MLSDVRDNDRIAVGYAVKFLDHHLRCGNSVLGAWVRPTMDWMQDRGALISNRHLASLTNIVRNMEEIEGLTDTDVTQVHQSKELFEIIAESSGPIAALLSLAKADDLMGVLDAKIKRPRESASAIRADGDRRLASMADGAAKDKEAAKVEKAVARAAEAERKFERAEAMKLVHEGTFGDPSRIANGEIEIMAPGTRAELDLGLGDAAQGSLIPDVRPDDRRRALADELVREARSLAEEHRFFHWEVAYPGVWSSLSSHDRSGGFDAVIGNPPYVRQEEIGAIKPALASGFVTYAGTADLYVYFYEQGIKLLRPGGRMGYVVTNKWLKAGYAEELRRMFAEDVWIEFMADFGHARHLFPDADVFPCVISVRKPDGDVVPDQFDLAVIPRDDVPRDGLAAAVAAATYRAMRSDLSSEAWVLEPPDVAALLKKIRERGTPLADYAGVSPLYGIKTGFNEAFLINTPTRDQLVRDDPAAAEIIKPYLRGQDIGRWLPEWAGLWMIFARRGIQIERYPSVLRHLERYRPQLEPKPENWKPAKQGDVWPGRKEGRYKWFEIQDAVDYWEQFQTPKIIYQVIQYYPQYSYDESGLFGNDKTFVIPTGDKQVCAILNSPLIWWHNWRHLPHLKDEALSPMGYRMETVPIAKPLNADRSKFVDSTEACLGLTRQIRSSDSTLCDWLKHEIGLSAVPMSLRQVSLLDSDSFVAAVRAGLPRRQGMTPTQLRQLRDAFAETAEPARSARIQLQAHERSLAAMVERAYGLTDEEVALMWRTAPPRMPLPPPVGMT